MEQGKIGRVGVKTENHDRGDARMDIKRGMHTQICESEGRFTKCLFLWSLDTQLVGGMFFPLCKKIRIRKVFNEHFNTL